MRKAKNGYIYVLTEKGYRCTPDTVKLDQTKIIEKNSREEGEQ